MNNKLYIGTIVFLIVIYLLNAIRNGFSARNIIETFIAIIIFFGITYFFRTKSQQLINKWSLQKSNLLAYYVSKAI